MQVDQRPREMEILDIHDRLSFPSFGLVSNPTQMFLPGHSARCLRLLRTHFAFSDFPRFEKVVLQWKTFKRG